MRKGDQPSHVTSPAENPFTPTFGQVPLFMAGRNDLLSRMGRAFDQRGRAIELTTLISGARGTGKTSLLGYVAEMAERHGWVSVSVAALPGLLDEVYAIACRKIRKTLGTSDGVRLAGVGVGGMRTVEGELPPQGASAWRTEMEDILDLIEDKNLGLLITVDEVRPDVDEVITLAATYQQFVCGHRRVALIMAGLAYNVEGLASHASVSFLRWARREWLGRIERLEIEDAWQRTVAASGRKVSGDATDLAVAAIDGSPLMLQLVGYRAWDRHVDNPEISYGDVAEGVELARRELASSMFELTYRELSDKDLAFLRAMLPDRGESSIADIAARMGKTRGYVSTYRKRMLQAGIIGVRRRGYVGFDLPSFREFLEERETMT